MEPEKTVERTNVDENHENETEPVENVNYMSSQDAFQTESPVGARICVVHFLVGRHGDTLESSNSQ